MKNKSRNAMRIIRHKRLRGNLAGTAERPRMSVFRSLDHIYVQIIDDDNGHTLVSASTVEKVFADTKQPAGNIEAAKYIGKLAAERAKQNGIETVVFDRGGHIYLGKVKALADAAREAGLKF
ncbi:MAG: 50S ribosomal protein L18 [Synergistaceae bacterium]|nr:50S ribosomal protein L18 [Synergistaceae bacterium]